VPNSKITYTFMYELCQFALLSHLSFMLLLSRLPTYFQPVNKFIFAECFES